MQLHRKFCRILIPCILIGTVVTHATTQCLIAQDKSTSSTQTTSDWGQFLGPMRNGLSKETGLIDRIEGDGPRELWRVPMVGGLSGIAISKGKLFTLSQSDDKQWLTCLDTGTGKPQWKTPLAPVYENQMGNGPRSTPTIQDDVAYTYTGEGVLAAVAISDGKLLWSTDLPTELKTKPSDYGMSCSPLVLEKTVVVHTGADNAALVAVNRTDGKIVWKAGSGAAGYSSPVLMNLQGKSQIISLLGGSVVSLDPATGKQHWSYPYVTQYFCNTACPIAIGDDVLLSAGENHGSVLLGLEQKAGEWKVSERWKSLGAESSLRSEWQTPVVIDGSVYGFDNVGSAGPVAHLACVDVATGKSLWKKLRFGKGNLIAADGKLIVSTVEGEIVLVKATKEGFEELGRKTVLGFTRQAPVLLNRRIYMRDEAELVCLDFAK